MRVVLLHNPYSGRAKRAESLAAAIQVLESAGVRIDRATTGPNAPAMDLVRMLRGDDTSPDPASALIVGGGDGSVHHAAPAAIAADVPIYHFPLGTENLFAREFGMKRSPQMLMEALRGGRVRPIDVGCCNDRLFTIMASSGFDASVVRRVAAARVRGVRRIDYVRHAWSEIRGFHAPRLSVVADGTAVVKGRQGLVIVANMRQYAARLDPARRALPNDGLLDVLFLPFRTRAGLLAWIPRIFAGLHLSSRAIVTTRAKEVVVRGDETDAPLQLDGEAIPPAQGPLDRHIHIKPGALKVLLP